MNVSKRSLNMFIKAIKCFWLAFFGMWCLYGAAAHGQESSDADLDIAGSESAGGGGNASNPLAAVSNVDLRWKYLDLVSNAGRINDYFIDGAFMVNPKLKIKYELHYWETNVTGKSESDFEKAVVKIIYFPTQGMLKSGAKYRVAVGMDLIADFGNMDKGIGLGADQIGPFAGVALMLEQGWVLIPLVQHFHGISGVDLNITAARLIAIKTLPNEWWLKLDAKLPYDWEAKTIPADAEIQLGKNINKKLALYVEGQFGIGGDRLYDWGVGLGIRFKF